MKVQVVIGNIANQPDIEAIVNSANGNLKLGSGVAGAIHTAAGLELEEYCQQFAPLPHGQAVITPGFKLHNKWVIHTRAANYLLDENAEDILKQCFESVWRIVNMHKIKSLAFPSIGTGVNNLPDSKYFLRINLSNAGLKILSTLISQFPLLTTSIFNCAEYTI